MTTTLHDRLLIASEILADIGGQSAMSATVKEAAAALAGRGDWTPSKQDYDRSIHSNPDAAAWADFFVATFPGQTAQRELMLGWFANAMMAMHDHLKAATDQPKPTDPDMAKALEWVRRVAAFDAPVTSAEHLPAITRAILAFDPERARWVNELIEAAIDAHDFAVNKARNEGVTLNRRFYRLRAAIERLQGAKP